MPLSPYTATTLPLSLTLSLLLTVLQPNTTHTHTHTQGKKFGLVPSNRAKQQAAKLQAKLDEVSDEDLHPLIKRMTTSP
jgi:hypothetical protein